MAVPMLKLSVGTESAGAPTSRYIRRHSTKNANHLSEMMREKEPTHLTDGTNCDCHALTSNLLTYKVTK